MKQVIKELCALNGTSGREEAVRAYIQNKLVNYPWVENMHADTLGNLLVKVKGKQAADCTVMFAAHMDEVGIIVTGIDDNGLLSFDSVGGVDPAVLFGKPILVGEHIGIIGGKAVHMLKAEEKKKLPTIREMRIDLGVTAKEEAQKLVHPGDVGYFIGEYRELEGGYIKAKALDDRAGCALLMDLIAEQPAYDLTLAFTVQEEVGLRGAGTAAYGVRPDIAVVVDVTTAADTVGVSGDKRVSLTKHGAVVSFMDGRTLYDAPLYQGIMEIAKENQITVQTKSMVAGGNDAGAIQSTADGARVAAISLPGRYIHSPCSVIHESDLESAAKLLKAIVPYLATGAK